MVIKMHTPTQWPTDLPVANKSYVASVDVKQHGGKEGGKDKLTDDLQGLRERERERERERVRVTDRQTETQTDRD